MLGGATPPDVTVLVFVTPAASPHEGNLQNTVANKHPNSHGIIVNSKISPGGSSRCKPAKGVLLPALAGMLATAASEQHRRRGALGLSCETPPAACNDMAQGMCNKKYQNDTSPPVKICAQISPASRPPPRRRYTPDAFPHKLSNGCALGKLPRAKLPTLQEEEEGSEMT